MPTYQLSRAGTWDYPTLGFRATNGDIFIGTTAPDAFWVLISDGPAETVVRYGVGSGTPAYTEPVDGTLLAYNPVSKAFDQTLASNYFAKTAVQTVLDGRYGLNTVVRTYTTVGSTTWTKPAGLRFAEVVAIGGGGGGASGRRGAAATARFGGGAGQGGGFSRGVIPAALLNATETVLVGAGGAGGAAVTVDNTNGNAGANGITSSFGDPARGGIAGWRGGSGTAGTGGSGNGGSVGGGSAGGSSSVTAAAADGTSSSSLAAGGAGGGGGGGISASDVAYNGGLGGASRATWPSLGSVALLATPSGAAVGAPMPGLGGPGGSASLVAAGGDGIAGAIYGAGGGGGAASVNGFNSGKGGDGAQGIVIVIEHY